MLYEPNKYSFELNSEMLQLLHDEFDVEKITSKFAEALNGKGPEEIEKEGKAIFETYGRDWIRKVHQLGDEYPDRTYEVLKEIIDKSQANWRKVVSTAAELGIPVPAFSSALAYYDSYRSERLPANLLQAQRDYFGAHTYQRTDKEGIFHSEWT